MTPQEFCYWLQGFVEMAQPTEMNAQQVEMMKKHLNLVFTNVTQDVPEVPEETKPGVLTDQIGPIDRLRRLYSERDSLCSIATRTYC